MSQVPSLLESETGGVRTSRFRISRETWRWLLAWEIPILILTGAGLKYWKTPAPAAPVALGLRIVEQKPGQLLFQWNPSAAPVRNAAGATLEIGDGVARQSLPLPPAILSSGKFLYPRAGSDVDVQMTVVDVSGNQIAEASRFLGQPVTAQPDQFASSEKHDEELSAEVRRLRQVNGSQSAQIRKLSENLRAIEAKLGISEQP